MREAKTQVHTELKAMVAEAVRSLAKLDADRLEELALSCRALNCGMAQDSRQVLTREERATKHEMAALARVLRATGENAAVMKRLHELRSGQMEYAVAREMQVKEREVLHGIY
jgi:hypothetical protein